MDIKSKIRVIEDFPKEGISFKDITSVLKDGKAYKEAILMCAECVKDVAFDCIVGPEARGFLIGAPLAVEMGKGFVPVRKPGRLPYETISHAYALEYGTDRLEMHVDGISKGDRVLVVDDLLATGGTAKAVCEMVERLGGIVAGVVFLIELDFLKGREMLEAYPVYAAVHYDA